MTAENQNKEPSQEGRDNRNLNIQGSVDESTAILGDHNTIHQGPNYYTTNVFQPIHFGLATSPPSQSLSKQEYRWRQVLVDNVKHYWIEGVLKRSLYNQTLIQLGLEERSNAVASPLSGVEEFPEELGRTLTEGTQATDIFDRMGAGRTLLILGDPGAGKTTTLLKLAQSLLERMGNDLSQPIPIILNLSSWAKKRQSIEKWLVQDLYETFQVSKSLGKTWIDGEQLILCLDGLDEVAEKYRNDCLEGLNKFIQEHGRTEMVVCSRIKDYEALSGQLRLRSAIYVQPLTLQQVDQYLEQVGEPLTALKIALNQTAEIKTLAASPLTLSVMSLVYQDCSIGDVHQWNNITNFQQRLFGAYVQRMLQRRGNTTYQYPDEQTIHWLIWMAQRMEQTSQTVFLIERIQPSWLQLKLLRLQYRLESALINGVIFGLAFGLVFGSGHPALSENLKNGLIGGVISGVIAGLIAGSVKDIQPVETLKWSWKEAKKALKNGFFVGVSTGLIVGMSTGLIVGVSIGSIAGLLSWLIVWLIVGLSTGLKGPGMERSVTPNQGIFKSAQNALYCTFIFALISGLILMLITGLVFKPTTGISIELSRDVSIWWYAELTGDPGVSFFTGQRTGLAAKLSNTPAAGLIGGLVGGGSACLSHFSLRTLLYRIGYIPWNYARFLDYATERLFLQKVGGGYIFVHRMLLEHFAQMNLEQKRLK